MSKSLNYDLQDLSIHMTFIGKGFNEVLDYVRKLIGVAQVG